MKTGHWLFTDSDKCPSMGGGNCMAAVVHKGTRLHCLQHACSPHHVVVQRPCMRDGHLGSPSSRNELNTDQLAIVPTPRNLQHVPSMDFNLRSGHGSQCASQCSGMFPNSLLQPVAQIFGAPRSSMHVLLTCLNWPGPFESAITFSYLREAVV